MFIGCEKFVRVRDDTQCHDPENLQKKPESGFDGCCTRGMDLALRKSHSWHDATARLYRANAP